jgi:mercuric ion transport protein
MHQALIQLGSKYRSGQLLLVVAAIFLLGGAGLLWRQRASACASGTVCAKPAVQGLTAAGLLLGTILLVLGYAYA